MEVLAGNTELIMTVIGAIVTLGTAVASFTKSKEDDKTWSKIKKIVDRLSLLPTGTLRGKNSKPRRG